MCQPERRRARWMCPDFPECLGPEDAVGFRACFRGLRGVRPWAAHVYPAEAARGGGGLGDTIKAHLRLE